MTDFIPDSDPGLIEVTELTRFGANERGWVLEPVSDAELAGLLNIHVVCAEPGSVRGNHYHRHKEEHICVLGGAFLFVAVDNQSGVRQETAVTPDRNLKFRIPPNVSHAMKNIGSERGYLLCYSDKAYDPNNPDTVKNTVLGETEVS
ncbi:MAG: cupin domain-containing protein [Chloroflexi bacterium]|nr:cupin domain-containing protein [Chloroflexota bacterium]